MATVAQHASIGAGTFLYHEGDGCEQFALVGTGSIRVFKTDKAGNQITLYHMQDGQACLVNMLSLVLERPAMGTAIVEISTEAVLIAATVFRNWIETVKGVRELAFESMAQRLIHVMVLAEELAFRRVDQRLTHLLLDRFSNKRRSLQVLETTHEELARELGTAREVVSRLLKEMERTGAVKITRGRIELSDKSMLLQLAGGFNAPPGKKRPLSDFSHRR